MEFVFTGKKCYGGYSEIDLYDDFAKKLNKELKGLDSKIIYTISFESDKVDLGKGIIGVCDLQDAKSLGAYIGNKDKRVKEIAEILKNDGKLSKVKVDKK